MTERDIDSERLIRLVRDTPVIWDRTCEAYKNRLRTQEAWQNICKEIRTDFELFDEMEQTQLLTLVKKKWYNIRDHWQKNCKKMNSSKYGIGQHRPRKYVFYDLLRFLEDGQITEDHPTPADCSTEPCKLEVLSFGEQSEEEVDEPASMYVNSPCDGSTSTLDYTTTNKRRKTDELYTTLNEPHEDRHLMFFKSIVPSLRTFNDEQTIDFQLGVMQLIRTLRNPPVFPPNPNGSSHLSSPPRSSSNTYPQTPRTVLYHQDHQTAMPKGHVPPKITSTSTPNTQKTYTVQNTESALMDHSSNSQFSESNV